MLDDMPIIGVLYNVASLTHNIPKLWKDSITLKENVTAQAYNTYYGYINLAKDTTANLYNNYLVPAKDKTIGAMNHVKCQVDQRLKLYDLSINQLMRFFTYHGDLKFLEKIGINEDTLSGLWVSGITQEAAKMKELNQSKNKIIDLLIGCLEEENKKIKKLENIYKKYYSASVEEKIESDSELSEGLLKKADIIVENLRQVHLRAKKIETAKHIQSAVSLGIDISQNKPATSLALAMRSYNLLKLFVDVGINFYDNKKFQEKAGIIKTKLLDLFATQARIKKLFPEVRTELIDGELADYLYKREIIRNTINIKKKRRWAVNKLNSKFSKDIIERSEPFSTHAAAMLLQKKKRNFGKRM